MIGWRWIGLAVLPVAALVACDDDADADGSTHAALQRICSVRRRQGFGPHDLAHEACEEIEAASAGDRDAAIARAVAEGKEEHGASPEEVLEILAEECPDLLPPG